ncbi:hypothetical protein E1262_27275 [Jiangella aurantiaca]|uniref:HNH endonuclease n=1 Tax=Jiangella aurantiaca TaxID=2530373 RepID=A0A4R5A5G6_9ACTN|nr:hypothetical protein [Jiangella aurantiaca]TDD64792.1 hypothetical protein E1262_27275 [Jiangella aurantiaca]
MPANDTEAAALAELDRLTASYTAAAANLERARAELHDAIIRHLRERSAPPGKIADHTPYDRNHIGRLGRAAGVPPIRGQNPT